MASTAAGHAQEVASTASEKGQEVVAVATDQVREVTGTVKQQAARVGGEAVDQGRTLAGEAKTQIEQQAHAQSRRLADTLSKLGDEAQALAEGRPDDAENLQPPTCPTLPMPCTTPLIVSTASLATSTPGAWEGVLEDLQAFARRRPGAFLLGAAVAGFGIGRAVRANSSDGDDASDNDDGPVAVPATRTPARARSGGSAPAPADRIAARAAIARAARTR